jgi:transposase
MAYSKEFRGQVLAACDRGLGTQAVALKFEVSESWVRRINQERRERGKLGPATKRNRTPKWAAVADEIRTTIKRTPDLTLEELQRELNTSLSCSTLCRALQALKLSLKKKSSMPPSSRAPMWPNDELPGVCAK